MYQSDRNIVSPSNDASLYFALSNDSNGIIKRGNNLNVTASNGLSVTVDTGQAIVEGRLVEVTEPEVLDIPANSNGRVCITVDLTKNNTVIGNASDINYDVTINQVYLSAVVGDLIQDNLLDNGFIFQFPIANYSSNFTNVTVIKLDNKFNDTGWLNLKRPNGIIFNNANAYAKYRVRNNIVFMKWDSINVLHSINNNQIGSIPSQYAPDSSFTASSLDYASDNIIYPIGTHVNIDGTLYVDYYGGHAGNLFGEISYPI